MHQCQQPYPPIADYALISDCHCTALVSKAGSIDWCCMPRMDSDSCFGRLLDWELGGYCAITPTAETFETHREYLDNTLILKTHFKTAKGEAVVYDFFTTATAEQKSDRDQLVRIIEGIWGEIALSVQVSPRFDFGEIAPYIRCHSAGVYTAWGSNQGLAIHFQEPLELDNHRDLHTVIQVKAGRRHYLSIHFDFPECLGAYKPDKLDQPAELDQQLEACRQWWQDWRGHMNPEHAKDIQTLRSVSVLKGLTFERTGAIIAASTTSLPEWLGDARNWDYRYSWIRDSVFAVRALHELGFEREAARFGSFIQRSSAGSADELQVMYGVDGKRRLPEITLDWLAGYRGSQPVRVGNHAARQTQLDIYAELMEMAWVRHEIGEESDPEYWDFLAEVVNLVCVRWQEPDHGIWEVRNDARHFVYSKAFCWAAIKRGIDLARACGHQAPLARWQATMDEIAASIEQHGYDQERGIYVQAYGHGYMDAALLLLPRFHYVAYDDPRMIRTTQAILDQLGEQGLLLRYNSPDGLGSPEGAFLPCTFWLVSALAHQGRCELAEQYYQRALRCANDLGLFTEEYDVETGTMLGNFPQALTHVSQITARQSLVHARQRRAPGDQDQPVPAASPDLPLP